MGYKFYTADVFTNQMFGGNQLAVFPQAAGLSSKQMQLLAKEFNLSETVFVLPAETEKGKRRLRIFTPNAELPFAGHPTVGTAYVLGAIGEIPLTKPETRIIFEEGVGPVEVVIRTSEGKPVYSELKAAKLPEYGPPPPTISQLAQMLSLEEKDFLTGENQPQAVSCGVYFLFIALKNRSCLKKARLNRQIWQTLLADYCAPHVYIFTYDGELDGTDVRSRMFAPAFGIEEDPATGSAAAALAGYLAPLHPLKNGTLHWVIEQGFEMGRPSIIHLECDKEADSVTEIRVGGASVLVGEGQIYL